VVDTNVLVYDTFEDSLYHEAAARLLDSLDRWLIPLIVVYEYVWVLKGLNVEPTHVREKLLEYLTEERCSLVREGADEVRWAISTVVEEGLSVARFNDKVVLSIAIRRNAPLATFDAKLRSQAKRLGIQAVPETI
jgi:predicted nucleic acid-binding protein